MAEGMGLPEGSTEASSLEKGLKETKSLIGRIGDVLSTLVVIVAAGLILKACDFTSAKETEFNDKAHSFAAQAIAAQLQFAQAANDQKVAAETLERAILNGQDANIVSRLRTTYESSFSNYQLKNYDLIRLSDNGDIRHFLAGDSDSSIARYVAGKVGIHSPVSNEMSDLQNYVTGTLGPAGRHHDCVSGLADQYLREPEQAKAALSGAGPIGADGKPLGIVCKEARDGRLYVLSDELTRLDNCETQVERRIYGLADKLMIDGWLKVGAGVDQSASKLPHGYLWTSAKPCTSQALTGSAPGGVMATIDRLPSTGPAQPPPPVAAPAPTVNLLDSFPGVPPAAP
jgi:hypothetical protein